MRKSAGTIASRLRNTARVETKIFVFVFSWKFIFAFREKSLRKVTETTKFFAKMFVFRENENVWENGRRKREILWNILRCQIRMVLQNKSDNSNWHALLYCLLRMVLQNKSDNCTVHHALLNRIIFAFRENGKNLFRFNPKHSATVSHNQICKREVAKSCKSSGPFLYTKN
jgi:hypothetical protein